MIGTEAFSSENPIWVQLLNEIDVPVFVAVFRCPRELMSNSIRLRKVRVHNLQSINLDLPKRKLIGFCGPSGSGKSSVAIDTLFAEGQRRFLDTFSMAERGLFDQPEKPDADEIEAVPPAIALTRSNEPVSDRVTVGSMTELSFLLQLAYSRFAKLRCSDCEVDVEQYQPDSIVRFVQSELENETVMIGFDFPDGNPSLPEINSLIADGFVRGIHEDLVVRIDSLDTNRIAASLSLKILVDRIRVAPESLSRLTESIELAFQKGNQECFVVWPDSGDQRFQRMQLDNRPYRVKRFSAQAKCPNCSTPFQRLSASDLSANSLAGACSRCEGLGKLERFQANLLVGDKSLSLDEGAIKLLGENVLNELRSSVASHVRDDFYVPWAQIAKENRIAIIGSILDILEDFYRENETNKIRRLMDPFRGFEACDACYGYRLNKNALSHFIDRWNLGQLSNCYISDLLLWIDENSGWWQTDEEGVLIEDIRSRIEYLQRVGLGYLSLGREINSLSTGERQRVSMTNALGSKLVNMLYIFDEPCAGLHPVDVPQLVGALRTLSDQGNSVIAVDHELSLISELDHVTEFGPGAGIYGGQVVYSGETSGLKELDGSVTGDLLGARTSLAPPRNLRPGLGTSLVLRKARGNNLKSIDVSFPLGVLCAVTGVSGSGKSSLVVDTLYPAVQSVLNLTPDSGLPYESLKNVDSIDDVVIIDQSPLGAASRSNPATYCKAFDAIRNVFAETVEARARNIKAGRFSFNTDGGRCDACKGEGTKQIDMKFMSNIRVKCKFCKGLRYKQEVLNCRYRGVSISEVLEMTVREAFGFFRGQKKVQAKLKPLIDVGLDYVRLGQPSSTLSSGESQRLRLAGYLTSGRKARTLFILDEPTVGLHYCDISKLLDCFDALIAEGHSIILVEHNRMVMAAADHVIDLGPDAGENGGQVVATGTPSQVANISGSKTGRVLREILA